MYIPFFSMSTAALYSMIKKITDSFLYLIIILYIHICICISCYITCNEIKLNIGTKLPTAHKKLFKMFFKFYRKCKKIYYCVQFFLELFL